MTNTITATKKETGHTITISEGQIIPLNTDEDIGFTISMLKGFGYNQFLVSTSGHHLVVDRPWY